MTWGPRAWPGDAALTAALPAALRAQRAALLLSRAGSGNLDAARELAAEVAACPVPWPPVLADAAVGALARAAAPNPPAPNLSAPHLPAPNRLALARSLLILAGRGLPAGGPRDYAATLARLAASESPWSQLLNDAAETIARRRAFLTEL